MNHAKTLKMVQLALLLALLLMLAFVPNIGYIKIPILAIQATTVHIPVIIGSIVLGPKAGAFLGGVFGLTSLLNNTFQPGATSFCFSPFVSMGDGLGGSPLALIICFVPRILCGVLPYFIYKAFSKLFEHRKYWSKLSFIAAGIGGSMTNTILVMSFIYIFFGRQWAVASNIAFEALFGVILSVVFINGTVEALIAALLSGAVSLPLLRANERSAK